MKIFHNPRCRKSRETLALIESKGIEPEIILYLEDRPTKQELKSIIEMLNIDAESLIRKGESIYKTLYKGNTLSEPEWIQAMIDHPKLMERPIVIKGDLAIIGRPPENVLELL